MAQHSGALAIKPNDLSSILGAIWKKEKNNSRKLISDLYMCVMAHTCTRMHMQQGHVYMYTHAQNNEIKLLYTELPFVNEMVTWV